MKKPPHRIFDYTPRFYKPEHDEEERRKRKLGFRRSMKLQRKKSNQILYMVIIIAAIYVYLKLTGQL